jgi:beta-glucosidase
MEAYGVSYWLAPALNIHRNPLCGRNFEYYSEDPLLSGKLAGAVTRGVQSVPGRFVTLKHFACNNQETCRNTTDARVSVRALREIYLRGFEIAMEAAPGAVMSSYNQLNGVYTPNSHDLLTKILRCEWGFAGLVMSDWLSTGPGLAGDGEAIAAGNDLIMPGSNANVRRIRKALRKGRLTPEALATSAARVFRCLEQTKK